MLFRTPLKSRCSMTYTCKVKRVVLISGFVFTLLAFFTLLVSSCNQQMEVQAYVIQDSTKTNLTEETKHTLRAAPFSFQFWFKSWEIQAADTTLTATYLVSTEPVKTPQTLLQNTENEAESGTENLLLNKPITMVMNREKGRQSCSFSWCKEEPEMLKLLIRASTLNNRPVKRYQKLFYALVMRSETEKAYYSGEIEFSQ